MDALAFRAEEEIEQLSADPGLAPPISGVKLTVAPPRSPATSIISRPTKLNGFAGNAKGIVVVVLAATVISLEYGAAQAPLATQDIALKLRLFDTIG